jgi:hypothetical protein
VAEPTPPAHPNQPSRWTLALAFAGILFAGLLGAAIGWGIVNASCTEDPTIGDQLIGSVPGVEISTRSCDAALAGGTIVGAAIAAVGAGVVAGLMLRAQSEWRTHPPGARATRARSGGTPRRT